MKRLLVVTPLPLRRDFPNGFSPRWTSFLEAARAEFKIEVMGVRGIWEDWSACDAVALGLADDVLVFHKTADEERIRRHLRAARHDLAVFLLEHTARFAPSLRKTSPRLFVLEEGLECQPIQSGLAAASVAGPVKWLWRQIYWRAVGVRYGSFYRHLAAQGPVLAINEHERDHFAAFTGHGAVSVLPLGADCEYLRPVYAQQDIDIAVFGRFDQPRIYEPALELFRSFGNSDSKLRWAFVGKDPPCSVTELASDRIHVTGAVTDNRPWYAQARVVAVPALPWAGSKSTLINAWAMGKAVVTTPDGIRGVPAIHGHNVLVANSVREMRAPIIELLASDPLRARLGSAARETVVTHLNESRIAQQFREICLRLAARGSG